MFDYVQCALFLKKIVRLYKLSFFVIIMQNIIKGYEYDLDNTWRSDKL